MIQSHLSNQSFMFFCDVLTERSAEPGAVINVVMPSQKQLDFYARLGLISDPRGHAF